MARALHGLRKAFLDQAANEMEALNAQPMEMAMHAAGHHRGSPIDNGIDHVQHVPPANAGNLAITLGITSRSIMRVTI